MATTNTEDKKFKIAFFIDTFFPMVDGVVMVVDNYAKRLSEIADVTVFTTKARGKYDDSKFSYKVVRCPRLVIPGQDYDLPLPKLSAKFKKQINNGNFDIVHIHSPFGVGKMGVKYAKKHNIPVVATMHSQFKRDFMRATKNNKWLSNQLLKMVMKVFNKCDECWAVNSNVKDIYFKEYGATTEPKVHNNGTDLKPIKTSPKLDRLKEKYPLEKGEKAFLFVGRLTNLKNIFFIVKSLKIAQDRGFKFKMFFVGSGPDEAELKALVKKLKLNKNIFFLGKITNREEMSAIYAYSDLFLFPSLYDCSSLVQIEAASQKTPTVFLAESATADAVIDNVNGYLSDSTEEAYAEKIISIFEDKENYRKVKENAFEQLYLSWDDAVKIAFEDYKRLIIEKNEKN